MKYREIYLDLDGVCVDFNSAAIRAHGFNSEEILSKWATDHRGEFYPYNILDMKMDSFWDHIAKIGASFWIELKPYPWFKDLYSQLNEVGHVIFCSSSTRSPHCMAGKLRWLQERFGREFQDYIITKHKERLAHAQAYLIDDFDSNIEGFISRGGNGILFPQFWNSNHTIGGDPADYVMKRILCHG